MNTFVVYDSQFGNTERIATIIANTLIEFGQVRAVRVNQIHAVELQGVDLLVVGCPTQGWRPTPAMRSLLEHLSAGSLNGLAVACFDTRFQRSRWVTGSAARSIARLLRKKSASLLLPPESFFVEGTKGPLVEGEAERAAAWAQELGEKAGARQLVTR